MIALLLFGTVIRKATTTEATTDAATTNPFQNLYRHNTTTQCQETIYQPFLVGCPVDCRPYRSEQLPANTKNETTLYYRLTMEWYLGQPRLNLHPPLPRPNTFYDMGYNYECPTEFVDAFGRASDHLEDALLKQQQQQRDSNLTIKTQTRMHISLAYLCCLRLEEAYHVQEIMQEFIHSNDDAFHIPNVNFERIECWKERFNSITHIIVVDNASQHALLKLLHRLELVVLQANISVPISRQIQMPFHSTLLGVQLGNKTYSTDPRHNIDPILPLSFQTVQEINRNLWPTHGVAFDIRHRPKYSAKPRLQAPIE
jgi:hypothetical protein